MKKIRNLDKNNGNKHNEAPDPLAPGHFFSENERAGRDRKDGFQAHEQRSDGRFRKFLGDDLERVANAARQ